MPKQIRVRVIPRAKKNEIIGPLRQSSSEASEMPDGALKIKLKAPPVDGKANEELVEFLSEEWGVSKSRIQVVSGQKGRNKVVKIS